MSEGAVEISIGEKFKDFIRNYRDETGRFKYMERVRRLINYNQTSLLVDYPDIYRYDTFLAEVIVDEPDRALKEAGEAVREIIALEDPEYAKKGEFKVRVTSLFDTISIRDIKSEKVGKLVQVEGIITRMLPLRSKMIKAWFRHDKCGMEFEWPPGDEILGERIEKPGICPVCGEGGGRFQLLKEKSKYVDWQKVVVQERPEDVPGGQMPRSIEVHLIGDIVDIARPGDRVTVVGIPRLEQRNPTNPLYEIYLEANSVKISEKILEEVSITREDEEAIRDLARDPWIREKIIASIAPSIYGHWDLKEAIALLLFGGVPKIMPDGTRIRGDIHVLFIGDPGVAKSQLLHSAARIAPRAVYTSGKGSTAAGLTAAVIKDPKTGEYYLEAGALVLADGGVAVIDEIDKMRDEDRSAIHEAMEQQTISISKAGIVARLNARASVLAAGNPKYGIYDTTKLFSDNVNLPPAILSRFDLIFVVRDVVNLDRDRELARYILEAHNNIEKFKPEIEIPLLKKYIIYARRYVRPKLTPQAKQLLEDFFVEMRSTALNVGEGGQAPIPITARQLEATVRLAEAHAKMALKDEVGEEDAEEAIRITVAFLESVGIDLETGTIDVGIITTGASFHTRKIMTVIVDVIKHMLEAEGKRCVKESEIVKKVGSDIKVSEAKIKEAIRRLHQDGIIYEIRPDCFKVA